MTKRLESKPQPPREGDERALVLGNVRGREVMESVKEYVADLDQQERVYFFSGLLRVPVNCMKAGIGVEATMAILDTAKEYLTNG